MQFQWVTEKKNATEQIQASSALFKYPITFERNRFPMCFGQCEIFVNVWRYDYIIRILCQCLRLLMGAKNTLMNILLLFVSVSY